MSTLNFIDNVKENIKRLDSREEALGKGLLMPFNGTNSGSRKLMYSTQCEHRIPLMEAEPALLQTGYCTEFGMKSSSITIADKNYVVIDKIVKQSNRYYLIVQDETGMYDVIERIPYKHTVETYGYLYNNSYLDSLKVGSVINKEDTIVKSTSFDEFNNRQDGTNLYAIYMNQEFNKEDGIIISESASHKLASPLIKKVRIVVNDNNIPLNLYGDETIYKSMPDIGEYVKNGILCALRIEKIEDALFSQSVNRLRRVMMSDDTITTDGQVIDIDIFCNNKEILETKHFSQFKYYNDKYLEFSRQFASATNSLIQHGKCSYRLQKMNYTANAILNGEQYILDKQFSNLVIDLYILDIKNAETGDKIANRFGGKGVISIVRPDYLMPRTSDGKIVDIIWNSCTCINRENVGQLFELAINHISSKIIDFIDTGVLSLDEIIDMVIRFKTIIVPEQANAFISYINSLSIDDKMMYVESMLNDKGIIISSKPLTDRMDIDIIRQLYNEFPFAKPYEMQVPQEDSNNNIRYINARRPLSCGCQYIYRLKQYAEDKFSVVSLAATNNLNLNSRNNLKKNYKTIHSRTPPKFGEMETGNMIHLGVENVIANLLLHSSSPDARRLCKDLLIGDPFNPNIELNENCRNRNVEIINAYLMPLGLELEFKKIPKKRKNIFIRNVFDRTEEIINPFLRIDDDKTFDYETHINLIVKNWNSKNIFLRDIFLR